MAGNGSRGGSSRSSGGSLAERRHANALAKGVRKLITDADRRRLDQAIATAQRRVDEYARRPPRNAFGLDRNAITAANAQLSGLLETRQRFAQPGAWRRKNAGEANMLGKQRMVQRRVARRNAEFMQTLEAIRRASR
jgi:hypothetical protein